MTLLLSISWWMIGDVVDDESNSSKEVSSLNIAISDMKEEESGIADIWFIELFRNVTRISYH